MTYPFSQAEMTSICTPLCLSCALIDKYPIKQTTAGWVHIEIDGEEYECYANDIRGCQDVKSLAIVLIRRLMEFYDSGVSWAISEGAMSSDAEDVSAAVKKFMELIGEEAP